VGRLKFKKEDGSVKRVAYLNELQEIANDLDDSIDEIEQVKTDYLAHTKNIMPHEFRDLKNDKTYKYGFQISGEGNPQLIFEEVKNV
jgi:hypothetical protein